MKKPKNTTARGINWSKVNESTYVKIQEDESCKLEILEDNTELVKSELHDGILHALEEVGLLGERFAKENLTMNRSVVTGRLRNSITHAIDSGRMVVAIGTNVEYAPAVELGTSRSKAKPYLVPAAQDHYDQYRQAFEKHLGGR